MAKTGKEELALTHTCCNSATSHQLLGKGGEVLAFSCSNRTAINQDVSLKKQNIIAS